MPHAEAKVHPEMHAFHMPSPSYYPAILALGVMIVMFGLLYMKELPIIDFLPFNPLLILTGVGVMGFAIYGWQGEVTAGK